MYALHKLDELTRRNLFLFMEEEIGDIALRLELNRLIVHFRNRDYEKILETLQALRPSKKFNIYAAYYPDVLLMELIALAERGKPYEPETETLLRYYTDYTKKPKSPLPGFHKKADGFIRKYHQAHSAEERKTCCRSYYQKLEPLRESFHPFHFIFLEWMREKL